MFLLKTVGWLVLALAAGLVLLSGLLYIFQRRLVYYPFRELTATPEQIGVSWEDVRITVTPGRAVHGWYVRAPDQLAPAGGDRTDRRVVLFCHGNAGNISHRLETLAFLLDLGADALLFDYRGYGLSDGEPSEENTYADAVACHQWLISVKQYAPDQIIVFGRSLGGAVAIDLASRMPCGGLIIESTFTAAVDVGRKFYPFLPVGWLLRDRYDCLSKIPRVTCPVLVTHSPNDEIVPYEMGVQLYEAARPPKRLVPLEGGHNERQYLTMPEYTDAMRRLMWDGLRDRGEPSAS